MYNHIVGRAASVVSHFYFILLGLEFLNTSFIKETEFFPQDSLMIKDIKILWRIPGVQKSNMQNAFGVQVHGEVLYLKLFLLNYYCFLRTGC